jgi:hypothetical protein
VRSLLRYKSASFSAWTSPMLANSWVSLCMKFHSDGILMQARNYNFITRSELFLSAVCFSKLVSAERVSWDFVIFSRAQRHCTPVTRNVNCQLEFCLRHYIVPSVLPYDCRGFAMSWAIRCSKMLPRVPVTVGSVFIANGMYWEADRSGRAV